MTRLDPMLVLTVRIEARARLWADGRSFDTPEDLMAPLYAHAHKHGLFDELGGVEGIDQMMMEALGALQREALDALKRQHV